MSANDENRKPTNHGTSSINTAIGPKDREGDPAYMNAADSSGSQGTSLQSPRAGTQATPSLPTIPETFGSISPTSPQYTLSQDSNGRGDNTPSTPEQHDTTSLGAQVTSASGTIQQGSDISASSSLSSYPSPQDDPQHPISLYGVDETDFAPQIPDRHFERPTVPAGLQNVRHQDMLRMDQHPGDSSGQPAMDSAPRAGHIRQPSVDERSHASGRSPCFHCDDPPPRSEFMSTFDPGPIRASRNPPLRLDRGWFWNPLTQQDEPDVQRPTRRDDRPMPMLPHERVDGGIGSSTRYSASNPPCTIHDTAPPVAPSYLDMTLSEIRRVLPPPNLDEFAIEDSPPSSRDGPSTHIASTAAASSTTNGHITIHSPQRNELSPLNTTNPYAPGRQAEMTPFPPFVDRMSPSDEETSSGAETSPRTHDRFDVPNTASIPPQRDTPIPSSVIGARLDNEESFSPLTQTPPRTQLQDWNNTDPQTRQHSDTPNIGSFVDTPPGLLALNPRLANANDEAGHIDQQEHESLARARTEPKDRVSRHEDSSSLRPTQSAGNNSANERPRVTLSEAAKRKADNDEKWRKDMTSLRASVKNEAHGGKRKDSDVGMHKPLVKVAKKAAAKVKETWLDTTSGKSRLEREADRAVKNAREVSEEVNGSSAEKTRLPSVTEIAKSPTKSLRRLSRRASRLFTRPGWDGSADDEPTTDSASPAEANTDQPERRRFSSFTGSMRGSIGNLASRMKPNFRRSRSEANVLGPTEENTMDVWRASREVPRPQPPAQTDATPNLNVQIDSSRLVSPTTTRTTPFDVHPGCLTACLTIDGQARCTHGRTVPIPRTESERRNDPETVPTMLDVVPAMTPDNGTSDESETSSQVEARSPNHSASK